MPEISAWRFDWILGIAILTTVASKNAIPLAKIVARRMSFPTVVDNLKWSIGNYLKNRAVLMYNNCYYYNMSRKLLSILKYLIGWPLSLVALFFVFNIVFSSSSKLTINNSQINFGLLAISVCLFFVYFLMRSFLWQLQLSENGYKINFRENTYRFSFSELKRFAPGNIWSFLGRAAQFSQLGVDKKTLGISLLADIQLVIIGCSFVSLLSIPWILNSPSELKLKLISLLPLSIIAITIFFMITAIIYVKKYLNINSKSILHSNKLWSNFLLPGFGYDSKIKLSLISALTYFIFGVGNFFAFASVFPSNLNQILELSSFFVFSLLLGYLSFITPMGLGVREGVITLGLSKIVSLADAGFFSVFSRIILIISELSFLLLVFIWKKSYKK